LYTQISEFVNKMNLAVDWWRAILPAADGLGGGRNREDGARWAAARPTENGQPVAAALGSSALE
jgi:hypothetical protein